VPKDEYERLQHEFPAIVGYRLKAGIKSNSQQVGLIENSGWKGYRVGDAGVHEKQALVLGKLW
jgi:UDP-N-acetylmuramate dehydrogenase